MMITFGIMLLFFVGLIVILQKIKVDDKSFTNYAVGDRSFGARYQSMSSLIRGTQVLCLLRLVVWQQPVGLFHSMC